MASQTIEKDISENPSSREEVKITVDRVEEKDSVVTDVVIVFDESGSMESMGVEPIQAVNAFIKGQQNNCEDGATMTLVMFNNNNRRIIDRVPLNDVSLIDESVYSPGGCTALNDAVCETIEAELQSKKPKNKVMVIVTDGLENSSLRHTLGDRKRAIENVRDNYDWKTIFIGANLDIEKEGESMGINGNQCAEFDQHIPGSLLNLSRQTSDTVRDFRRSQTEGNKDIDLVIINLQKNVSCPVTKQDKYNISMSLLEQCPPLTRSYANIKIDDQFQLPLPKIHEQEMNKNKTCEMEDVSDEDVNKLSDNTKNDVCVKVFEKGLWVGSENVFNQGLVDENGFDYDIDKLLDF